MTAKTEDAIRLEKIKNNPSMIIDANGTFLQNNFFKLMDDWSWLISQAEKLQIAEEALADIKERLERQKEDPNSRVLLSLCKEALRKMRE